MRDGTEGSLSRGESGDFIPSPPIRITGLVAESAVFLFIVEYRQFWWPFPLHKRVRYNISKDADGKWIWIRPYMSQADRTFNPTTTIIRNAQARLKALEDEAEKKDIP